ncbi:MAG TPA: cupin domain-containing protein [Anaerolineae bacterium]|jgi:quercetin dioxygenase-like cupin family protein|nr:cupin domain-containing protein [Anaerolineae bacterium]
MYKINYVQVQQMDVEEGGAKGVSLRWVLSEREGAENFALRVFNLMPGGNTPRHTHPWEHEIFVLKGSGSVVENGENVPIHQGDVIYIPPEEEHQFNNTGDSELEFICLIPLAKKCSC